MNFGGFLTGKGGFAPRGGVLGGAGMPRRLAPLSEEAAAAKAGDHPFQGEEPSERPGGGQVRAGAALGDAACRLRDTDPEVGAGLLKRRRARPRRAAAAKGERRGPRSGECHAASAAPVAMMNFLGGKKRTGRPAARRLRLPSGVSLAGRRRPSEAKVECDCGQAGARRGRAAHVLSASLTRTKAK